MEEIPPNVFTAISRASARRVTVQKKKVSRDRLDQIDSTVTDAPFIANRHDRESQLSRVGGHPLITKRTACGQRMKNSAS